jgi:hypothetical protein
MIRRRRRDMSEYQYYEFQAIDGPLTEAEMAALRSFSTRARITPTSFVNEYHWGDFKGNADAWMEKYFDAFLYLANWGTRIVKLRLPSKVLPLDIVRQYCAGDSAEATEKDGKVVVSLDSEEEPGGEWEDGAGWLAGILPVRAELARGDLRALYLGWLVSVQAEEVGKRDPEPPVPPGLGNLSAPLRNLAEFLRIDRHLIAAAAEASAPARGGDEIEEEQAVARWISGLPTKEKDGLLMSLVRGERVHLGNELLARFRADRGPATAPAAGPARTVAQLLVRAEELSSAAAKKAAEKTAAERARREAQAAAARKLHLDKLAGKEPELWAKAEALIATRLPANYDEAVKVLADLRDLAARSGKPGYFERDLQKLRAKHERKPTLMARIEKAGLGGAAI